jgi:hypothetical protein
MSWHSRRYGRRRSTRRVRPRAERRSAVSKYTQLQRLFGSAIDRIRDCFLQLDDDSVDELLDDYGVLYGEPAERYARETLPAWRAGARKLSGATLERLVELVPPYLTPHQRFGLLEDVVHKHKAHYRPTRTIRLDIDNLGNALETLQATLIAPASHPPLANIPDHVMQAATWLYDDDMTAARGVLAEVYRREHALIREQARKELRLVQDALQAKGTTAATYTVNLPEETLNIIAYRKSACFIAQVCCGPHAPETIVLKAWRDEVLVNCGIGRKFVIGYYTYAPFVAGTLQDRPFAMRCMRMLLRLASLLIFYIRGTVRHSHEQHW